MMEEGEMENTLMFPILCIMVFLRTIASIAKRYSRSIEDYERDRNGKPCREKMVGRVDMLPGHNCCGEALVSEDGCVPIVVE